MAGRETLVKKCVISSTDLPSQGVSHDRMRRSFLWKGEELEKVNGGIVF
jgi:hypothetical protein